MSKLTVNQRLEEQGTVLYLTFEGRDIPSAVFLHENTGSDELGDFAGVVHAVDFTKYATWEKKPVKVFGNRYVKSNQAKIRLRPGSDPNTVVENVLSSVKQLAQGLRNSTSSTQVYDDI